MRVAFSSFKSRSGIASMGACRNFMKGSSVRLSVAPVVIWRTCFLFVIFSIFIEA